MAEAARTIRIFVSSTFPDMHAERQMLDEVVFPRLRQRFVNRGLRIEKVDPRWGTSEQRAEDVSTLEKRLESIDGCRPFFLTFLGERYGTVPQSLPAEVVAQVPWKYPWLHDHRGKSLTEIEILHRLGREAVGGPGMLCYVRDSSFSGLVPEVLREGYLPVSQLEAENLAILKRRLLQACGSVQASASQPYPCVWDTVNARVSALEVLAERVIDDISRALDELLAQAPPPGAPPASPAGVQARAALDENVQFTVFSPKAVRPDNWYSMLAFSHREELAVDVDVSSPTPLEEIERRANEEEQQQQRGTELATSEEGLLTLVPHLTGFLFEPKSHSFSHIDAIHRVEFLIKATPGMNWQTARGEMTVFLGHLILAEIPLRIGVDRDHREQLEAEPTLEMNARTFRKVFASYSPEDLAIVEEFERSARVQGNEFLADCVSSRSGEQWSERLQELIDEADIFQLCWSSNAVASAFMRQEWQHALSLERTSFIRPTFWEEPCPKAPHPLSQLHFHKLTLETSPRPRPGAGPSAAPAVIAPEPLVAENASATDAADHPPPILEPAPEAVAGVGKWAVVVTEKTGHQRRHEFDKSEIYLGRVRANDVILPKGNVSKKHARIFVKDGRFILVDLKTTNGTYVNGRKITSPLLVQGGDTIYIDEFVLSIEASKEAIPPRHESAPLLVSDMPGSSEGVSLSEEGGALVVRESSLPVPPGEENFCLSCGTGNPSNIRFCGVCGAETTAFRAPPRSPPAAASSPPMPVVEYTPSPLRPPPVERRPSPKIPDALPSKEPEVAQFEFDEPALFDETLGLDALGSLLDDDSVTELVVSHGGRVYKRVLGVLQESRRAFSSEDAVWQLAERLLALSGSTIDDSTPSVETRLDDGTRITVIVPPLAFPGPCLTIRKPRPTPLALGELVKLGVSSAEAATYLQTCVAQRKSVLLAGPRESRLTILEALAMSIPAAERVVTVEHVAELRLVRDHVVSLATCPEWAGLEQEVSVRHLLGNALSMRPDRLVVGECRGEEALDVIEAMNGGCLGLLTSLHARDPQDALRRLELMVLLSGVELTALEVREQIASGVNVIVQLGLTKADETQITEVMEVNGLRDDVVELRVVYRK